MLELRDVTRSLGREPVFLGVNLEIARNAPLALLGLRDAAHRNAVLRLLSGVDRPQSGSVRLDGHEVARVRRDKGRIIRVGPNLIGPSGQRVGKLIGREAAERVRLAGRLDVSAKALDPEQRARLGLAIARSGRASLILLDAPGQELGFEVRERFFADLNHMVTDTGAVVVLAAATAGEARGLGGDVAVVHDGSIVQHGAAEAVFRRPANLAAALATSHPALNTLAMTAREGSGVLADGASFRPPDGLAMPAEGPCTLAFRPDDTALERASASCLRFVVRAAGEETLAGRRFVRLSFAGSRWLTPLLAAPPPAGMTLNAFVDRARLMVFDADGNTLGAAESG